ncbi:MAG: ABC transporter permease [Bacillota bacterium]|nr:ABC transporter permease [Bacillota bacterium]
MWSLITNEFQKIVKKRRFIVTTLIFSILLLIISVVIYSETNKTNWQRIQEYQDNIKGEKEYLKVTSNPQEAERARQAIRQLQGMIRQLYQDEDERKLDWRKRLENKIQDEEKKKSSIDVASDNTKIEECNKQILTYRYALDNDIKNIDDNSAAPAIDAIEFIVDNLGVIFIPLIIGIIVLDSVSGECTVPTMKMLLTKPVSRGKVLLSKYISSTIAAVIAIIGSELVAYIILGAIKGFGSANEPMVVGTRYEYNLMKAIKGGYGVSAILGSSYIIPMWKYIGEVLLMQLLFIAAFTALCIFVSVIIKNVTMSMGIGIVATIIISFISFQSLESNDTGSSSGFLGTVCKYAINTYSMPGKIISGDIIKQMNNPNISVEFAVIVILLTGLISYILSHLLFVKRDMLV